MMNIQKRLDRLIGHPVRITFKEGFPFEGRIVEGILDHQQRDLWGAGTGYAIRNGDRNWLFRKSHVRKVEESR